MTRRLPIVVVALLLGLGLMAVPSTASTFVAMDRAELVAASDAVIDGKVLSVHSFWNADGTAILTEAAIEVLGTLKGDAPAIVHVRTFGGEVGNYRIDAHGFPTFNEGDRMVLFLRGEHAEVRVTGYLQGQYRVVPDERGAMMAVPAVGHNVSLLKADGSPVEPARTLPLETLKAQIQVLAERGGPRLIEQ